jgi:hypothetical protein
MTQGSNTARTLPGLESGERLCEAFEIYREWAPDSDLDFEQAILLLMGAVRGEQIELGICRHCSAALLIGKVGQHRDDCIHCGRHGAQSTIHGQIVTR